ncbi:unnamed protein product [Schistosoma margrebowiei]|uniref:Uncharacterized protein n=1 Tax=Schistosoma margrebowiei TaxID=48269 RepID=A0A183LLA9_9TREM|nr:unnamed protein product [Schistosoma margrebowiei]
MKDVRTRRGANSNKSPPGCGQDETEAKESMGSWRNSITTFNTTFLQHTNKLNEFKIILNKRFQALQDLVKDESTMEDNQKRTEEVVTSKCQEVLGLKKHHHK